MKRWKLNPTKILEQENILEDLPKDLLDYVTRLKLLYEVPFSYLIAEEKMLPQESLRFFYVDSVWTETLAEGALSIGRDSVGDARVDKMQLRHSAPEAQKQLRSVRQNLIHENHKKGMSATDRKTASEVQSGFIMRSILVRRMKGLEISGSDGEKELEILRMEALSDEILLCIFDGEVKSLVIAEPKTGLRFGSPDDTRVIRVRTVADDESFGQYLDDTIDLNEYTEVNGRLNISALAKKLDTILNTQTGSAQVAYELIATAHRAEFVKNE